CSMRHTTDVTLLRVSPPRFGQTLFDQIVFAAKKAFVSGEFQAGQPFPSVRALPADLKIHPNTAHKGIQHLVQERYLEALPGSGTVVARLPPARAGDKRRLLTQEIEQLVVEAKRVGASLDDVTEAIETQWANLEKAAEVMRK